ncbi:MAG: TetR/AcrR family transcriptional regulator [Bernardetiaceae bacterium]
MRSKDRQKIWIEAGYQMVAYQGVQMLKVEPLAQTVGVSKSSFYHHFADMEVFWEALLGHHLLQVRCLADRERSATCIFPELIDSLMDHRLDLLFNRQLRINRHRPDFSSVIAAADNMIGDSFILLWVKELNLKLSPHQLQAFFGLALEHFFLQIPAKNLTHAWLTDYFVALKETASRFG